MTNIIPQEVLTDRQIKFAEEYVIDLSVRDAALRSGYTPTHARCTGVQLLKNPNVNALIQSKIDKHAKDVGFRRVDAVIMLLDICKDASTRKSDAIKAIDLLCRMHGWHAPDQLQVTARVQVQLMATPAMQVIEPDE